MDIALVLDSLVPAAAYRGSLTANTQESYESIVWDDERPKPSWAAVVAEWAALDLQIARAEKKEAVRALATGNYRRGFTYATAAPRRFRAEQDNVSEIAGMRQFAESSLTWISPKWPVIGGGFYAIATKAEMLEFSEAFLMYRLLVHNCDATHQQNIEILESRAEVDAYDITTGWPD